MKNVGTASPLQHLRFAILAVDNVLFTIRDGALCVRLIPVHLPPYFTHLAGLPGGLISPSETADQAAMRHLRDKAGMVQNHLYIEQLYTFSEIKRDPRGRVVAVAYLGLMPWTALTDASEGDTEKAWWVSVSKLPTLAYDHRQIIRVALERLRSRVTYTTLISKLMTREFTLTELEQTMEIVVGADIDKRNFRKKLNKLNILQPLDRYRTGEKHRPAQLYRFRKAEVVPIELI